MTESDHTSDKSKHVFISYSQKDKETAQTFAHNLKGKAIPVWIDDYLKPGTPNWQIDIRKAIANSFAVVYLASEDSGVSSFVIAELKVAVLKGCKIYPVWIKGTNWLECAPFELSCTEYIDLRENQYDQGFDKLCSTLRQLMSDQPGSGDSDSDHGHDNDEELEEPTPQDNYDNLSSGIAQRELVFGKKKLPGQVFAIELLTKPMLLQKQGKTTYVTVNRDGVTHGLYTGEGRKTIVEHTFNNSESLKNAKHLDKKIHNYLTVSRDPRFIVHQPNLRWASGGVVSIVDFRQRKWIPFFFRDIRPYGWNISLGASEESTDNLNDPWSFIMREFLEETLVCRKDPHSPNIIRRPFYFDRMAFEEEAERARELSARHVIQRYKRDGISIIDATLQLVALHVQFNGTQTVLIIEHKGSRKELHNVLIAVNITELGIETIKVINYELEDDDFILDGELYEPAGSNQVELVRMPVALISVDYLRRTFPSGSEYKFVPEKELLPSVLGQEIPPEDIHIFDHDVLRRRDIAEGRKSSATVWQRDCYENATEWEREWYIKWIHKFGHNFLDSVGKPSKANASRLFTPTSAKIIAYLSANLILDAL